jgi:predicted AAA+ superfamily ATPase
MFVRKQIDVLKKRAKEPRKFIQIISGPRQIGKTTLIEQFLDMIDIPFHYASADAVPASSLAWISQQWETARIKLKMSGSNKGLLVIDEIQKIGNWSEAVKKEWDSDTREKSELKVILLGSSTLLIQKGLTESLAGRFEIIKMPHWSYHEMNQAFAFEPEEYVWFGGFPGAAVFKDDEKRWKDYVLNSIIEPTISKDVLTFTSVQKPALLKNLFELGSFYSGQVLSYNKILGQLAESGNTTTLAHYQFLLERVWFLSGIQKFFKSKVSSKGSIPKWQVYNSSLVSVYSGLDFKSALIDSAVWGRLIESAIGAYLLNECRMNNFKLYYWKGKNSEVDFVVEANKKLIAIEVKSGVLKFHRGMEEFKQKYKPYKSILISKDSLLWQEFIKLDITDLM